VVVRRGARMREKVRPQREDNEAKDISDIRALRPSQHPQCLQPAKVSFRRWRFADQKLDGLILVIGN
jgi:hypothetical protein